MRIDLATLMTTSDLELLYRDVTEAIFRAEKAERTGDAARTAEEYFRVSCFEEEIASALPADDPNGAISRRSVVTAALAARLYDRAREFADHYLAELGAEESQRAKSTALRTQAEEALQNEASRARGVPWVAARHLSCCA